MENITDEFGKVLDVKHNRGDSLIMIVAIAMFIFLISFLSVENRNTTIFLMIISIFTFFTNLWSFKYEITTKGLIISRMLNLTNISVSKRFVKYEDIQSVKWNQKEGAGPIEIEVNGGEIINVPFEILMSFEQKIDELPPSFQFIIKG